MSLKLKFDGIGYRKIPSRFIKRKKNSVFNWISREKRMMVTDPKIDSPPVGYYSPNYSSFATVNDKEQKPENSEEPNQEQNSQI